MADAVERALDDLPRIHDNAAIGHLSDHTPGSMARRTLTGTLGCLQCLSKVDLPTKLCDNTLISDAIQDVYTMIRKSAVLTGFFPNAVFDAEVLIEAIRLAAELGYETAEFYHEGDLGKVRRALIEAGLRSILLPASAMKRDGMDLGGLSTEDMDRLRQWVDQAGTLGSERLMILSGPEHQDPEEREVALAATAAAAAEICSIARRGAPQVGVALEFFNNVGEPGLLLGPTDRAVELAKTVSAECSNFELTCDLSHLIQLGEEPVVSAMATASHSRHLHLANCVVADTDHPLFGDRHPPFGYEGGEVDQDALTGFLRGIQGAGYFEGDPVTVAVEIITRDGQDGKTLLREATQVVNAAFSELGL